MILCWYLLPLLMFARSTTTWTTRTTIWTMTAVSTIFTCTHYFSFFLVVFFFFLTTFFLVVFFSFGGNTFSLLPQFFHKLLKNPIKSPFSHATIWRTIVKSLIYNTFNLILCVLLPWLSTIYSVLYKSI